MVVGLSLDEATSMVAVLPSVGTTTPDPGRWPLLGTRARLRSAGTLAPRPPPHARRWQSRSPGQPQHPRHARPGLRTPAYGGMAPYPPWGPPDRRVRDPRASP